MTEIEVENKKGPQSDWYQSLIQDVNELIFEGIIETKWRIGKRILQDELKFEKPEYGSKMIPHLAADIGISSREVYRCLQFAKKVSHVTELEQFKDKSWRWICNEYLPKSRENEVKEREQEEKLIPDAWFEKFGLNPADYEVTATSFKYKKGKPFEDEWVRAGEMLRFIYQGLENIRGAFPEGAGK